MTSVLEDNRNVILGSLGLALTAVGVYYYTRQSSAQSTLSQEETKAVLRQLARRFHAACREFSEMAKSVKNNLEQKNISLPTAQMKIQLKEQAGVLERLSALQDQFLEEQNIDKEKLQRSQNKFISDPDIKMLADGLESMLDTSLGGGIPILPWVSEPNMAADVLLASITEMHEMEIASVCQKFQEVGGVLKSVTELGRVLSDANREAEAQIAKLNNCEIDEWYSNVGLYCLRDPNFALQKAQKDKIHRARMVRMFKPAGGASSQPPAPAPAGPAPASTPTISEVPSAENREAPAESAPVTAPAPMSTAEKMKAVEKFSDMVSEPEVKP